MKNKENKIKELKLRKKKLLDQFVTTDLKNPVAFRSIVEAMENVDSEIGRVMA